MTPAIQLTLLILLYGAACYLLGSYYGVRAQDAERTAREAYNRGWNDGQEVGNRSGRREGWYAAHKLALTYLKETPFSAPMKKLVKVLAAGEQPAPSGNAPDVLPILKQHSEAMRAISVTTPSPVTLTGDGPHE